MDGKEKIIAAILEEAAKYAREVKDKADSDYLATKSSAEENAASILASEKESLKALREESLKHRKTVAELDSKKVVLSAKREAVDLVFTSALKKLCSLDKSAYKSLIVKLINENAKDGQTVILSEYCPVSCDELSNEQVIIAKKLTVKGEGKFLGGVIIEGNVCDLNLSFEALIASAKEKFQTEIATALFGD